MSINEFDILEIICKRRRSHREFSSRPVEPGLLTKISDIALTSPYASGKKNWGLEVIDDRKTIDEIASSVRSQKELYEAFIREDFLEGYSTYYDNFTKFENAPAVFILSYRTPSSFTMMFDKEIPVDVDTFLKEWERDNYVKSISCVAMLVLLAAESLGLGACYMTGPLLAEKEIIKVANVKKGRRIGAIIPVGYKIED